MRSSQPRLGAGRAARRGRCGCWAVLNHLYPTAAGLERLHCSYVAMCSIRKVYSSCYSYSYNNRAGGSNDNE